MFGNILKFFVGLAALCIVIVSSHAQERTKKHMRRPPVAHVREIPTPLPVDSLIKDSKFRGWDYLVQKLKEDKISDNVINAVYLSQKMPSLGYVPFSVAPRESSQAYVHFKKASLITLTNKFLTDNKRVFDNEERQFGISREVIAAILLIETHFGKVVGKEMVINRLSRLASVGSPENLAYNLTEQQKKDPLVTFDQLAERAKYLESTFYPEVKATLEIAQARKISPLSIRGSSAGAFGMPQFLPSSYLRFGVDGNRDKVISLFNVPDAIFSTANFLKISGWSNSLQVSEKRKVIWLYNKSDAYVDAVLDVANSVG